MELADVFLEKIPEFKIWFRETYYKILWPR